MKELILLPIICLFAGCATGPSFDINQVQNLRVGMSESEVEVVMGSPYKRFQNPDGSETWIWDHVRGFTRSECQIILVDQKVYHLPSGIAHSPAERHIQTMMSQAEYTGKRQADADRPERERLNQEMMQLATATHKPFLGMSADQALTVFGKPSSKYVTVSVNTAHYEQWTYPKGMNLYFHDYILTSYQIPSAP